MEPRRGRFSLTTKADRMAEIAGIAAATVTHFGPGGGEIDPNFIVAQLHMLKRGGVHGVVPVGTNGEFSSLTMEEKKQVLATVAGDRGNLFMIAGAGSSSLPETIELVSYAAGIGADAALVVPPFYFKDAVAPGIIEFYRRVLESTDLPIFIYNIPMYSGIVISDEIIDSLTVHGNLAGIKDTGGEPERTRQLVERYPELKIFGGSDSLVGDTVSIGAAGVISGVANVFPGLLRRVWDERASGGDWEGAAGEVAAVRKIFKSYPWVAATKYALKLRGLPETCVRPPLIDLMPAQKHDLEKQLSGLGLI